MKDPALEVLFTPADFIALDSRDLSDTVCVVFDVLRATSSMITALANGASGLIPVAEISEAVALREKNPDILLAGERGGLRILGDLTGNLPFDMGNSPREFTRDKVEGRTIAITTTNGTRALRSCARAWTILVSSFLNLRATADLLLGEPPARLTLICSGTYEHAAYEDVLAAGALCDLISPAYNSATISDGAEVARRLYLLDKDDLTAAMAWSWNARRLLANADLADDVPFCLTEDRFSLVAEMGLDAVVREKP
jgi:2-phosphosulfolactate phosphatase